MFESLTGERLRAITSHTEGVEFSEIDAAVKGDKALREELHRSSMAVAVGTNFLPSGSCPLCMIMLNGIIWGIRLERAFNEERALEAVVRVEG